MANTPNLFALDSSTRRLGGKAHGAGHASPVSVGVGSGTQNLPGTVLRQRPSAEGCSIDGVSHLEDSFPFRFRAALSQKIVAATGQRLQDHLQYNKKDGQDHPFLGGKTGQ